MSHQRIGPEHLLKALLEDEQGMASGLIRAAGGDAGRALAETDAALARVPAVSGGGAQQTPGARQRRGARARPGRAGRAEGRRFLCHRRAAAARAGAVPATAAGKALAAAGVKAEALNAAINQLRQGRAADTASAEDRYDALKKFARDPDAGGARRQARSRHRPRRGDPPDDPDPGAAHQEQSRP
ncbi:MAG: Clp protease N-terminal domain-containing protein [Sphingomonas sp.]